MKKSLLALVAVVALGLSVVGTAQADVIDDIKVSGDLALKSNHLYRGVEDNQDTPVLLGAVQAQYQFVRLGMDARTNTVDNENALLKWNSFGELFHTLGGHELRVGLRTDEMPGSSNEIYVGAAGPLPLPWGLKYDATVSRSNQVDDVWLEGGVSKTFGDLTVRGGAAAGIYDETQYHNGLEYVTASATYKLTQVRHFENASLNATVTHNVDDRNIVRGVTTDLDTQAVAGINFHF